MKVAYVAAYVKKRKVFSTLVERLDITLQKVVVGGMDGVDGWEMEKRSRTTVTGGGWQQE